MNSLKSFPVSKPCSGQLRVLVRYVLLRLVGQEFDVPSTCYELIALLVPYLHIAGSNCLA